MPRGRPRGSPNKRTLLLNKLATEALMSDGITPLEVIGKVMRGDTSITERMLAAAIAAAPYVHPRLSTSEVSMDAKVQQSVVSAEPMTPEAWLSEYGDNNNDNADGEKKDTA